MKGGAANVQRQENKLKTQGGGPNVAVHLNNLDTLEGDQYLVYCRNLPEKVAEHIQLISGAGTVQQLRRAVNEYCLRSRATGSIERAHAVQGSPIRGKGCFNCGDPGHMQADCPKPKRCKHCGKSGHVASDCWEKHSDKKPSKNTKDTGANSGKGKGKGKSKGRGKGKKGTLREVEGDEGDWEDAEWEDEDLEEPETEKGQGAMVVRSGQVEASSAVPGVRALRG